MFVLADCLPSHENNINMLIHVIVLMLRHGRVGVGWGMLTFVCCSLGLYPVYAMALGNVEHGLVVENWKSLGQVVNWCPKRSERIRIVLKPKPRQISHFLEKHDQIWTPFSGMK